MDGYKITVTSQVDGGVLATYYFDKLEEALLFRGVWDGSKKYALCDLKLTKEEENDTK